jgi:hypothetical protein
MEIDMNRLSSKYNIACFSTLTAVMALSLSSGKADAHASAGVRMFPATLAVEDPAISNELTLPNISTFKEKEDGADAARVTEYEAEFSKKITENWGFSIENAYIKQSNAAGGHSGFDNWGVSTKYQAYKNAEHEAIIAVGLGWDIGSSGNKDVGAENFSTLTPQIFFGKGFGDLPDTVPYLKPFALTGSIGVDMPVRSGESDVLDYGFTLQYSIPYLQRNVKDIGLSGSPLQNIIPVVEFTFKQPLNNTDTHQTTGTINPGFILTGEKVQFGTEAIIPLNNDSGEGVDVRAQLHFYLDDIFSK